MQLIDFRKAFDSKHHKTYLKVLGFDIVDWIRLFFTNREAYIIMDPWKMPPNN